MAPVVLDQEIIDNLVIVVREQVGHGILALIVTHLRTMVDMEVSTQISLEITMVVHHQMTGGEVNCCRNIIPKLSIISPRISFL